MIKDLSASLVAAAAAINQKSREAFVAEQKDLQSRKTVKMPMQPLPKADPAAVSTAKKMAEAVMIDEKLTDTAKQKIQTALGPKHSQNSMRQTSGSARAIIGLAKTNPANTVKKEEVEQANEAAEGSIPKTPRERELAAKSGHPKRITFGDVLKARGVRKEEAVQEGMMDTMKKIGKKIVDTATHGSDEDLIKDLQKKTGVPQTGKKPVAEASGWNPIKHIPKEKQSDAIKTAAKDVKRGSYADRAALLKAGGVKEEKEESAAHEKAEKKKSPFDTSGPSTAFNKEKSAFTSKKVSTGTVYSRKPVKESEEVQHEQFGIGKTLPGQEAEDGSWIDVMFAEGIKRVETKDLIEAAVGASHIHVSPAGGGKYKVHAVGSKFASGIKVGEHLTDTHLDDFAEMGGKIKHVKAEKKD